MHVQNAKTCLLEFQLIGELYRLLFLLLLTGQ